MSDKSTTFRKIIMAKLNRDIRRTVRLSGEEDKKLAKLHKSKGQTLSEWIRDRIRQARLK